MKLQTRDKVKRGRIEYVKEETKTNERKKWRKQKQKQKENVSERITLQIH